MAKNSFLSARQTKFTVYATVYILVVIAALGLVNWLAQRYNKSVDTTANKRFSLSDQTEKVVKNLKDPVTITYWDKTSGFPPAKDLLDRYANLSTKLIVNYVDPDKKPRDARAAGIRQLGTIVVQFGQKREEARSLTEEEVTGAVIRTLKGGERSLCWIQGSGEHQISEQGRGGYSALKTVVEKDNYRTRTISLLEKAEIPKDCTAVVIAGPKFDYVPPVIAAIKGYIEGGGRALIMLDTPVAIGKRAATDTPGLTGLLAGWGVTPGTDLVLEASGVGQIYGFDASVALVDAYDTHPIGRELRGTATAFPLARGLYVQTPAGSKTSAEKLFSSTENSISLAEVGMDGKVNAANAKKGPFALGAVITYNTGQPNSQGRVVVTGSSEWVADSYLGFRGNRDLVLNMLNWLSSDEELISIRPKDPADNRIAMSGSQMKVLLSSSVILIPLSIIVMGVLVWWRRR